MVKAKLHHFREGLVRRPMFKRDAIGSDHDAGTVLAEFTVNKNRLRRRIAQYLEEMNEVSIAGIRKAANGNTLEMHAQGLDTLALFVGGLWRFGAEIDDGGDTEFLELK